MSLREYDDVTCLGRQAAYGDGFVLPESYRHPFKRRLRNVAFAEWAPRFVREPEPAEGHLAGAALPPRLLRPRPLRARAHRPAGAPVGMAPGRWTRHPDLRALLFAPGPGESPAEWELDLLEAGGIARDRLVSSPTRPTRVEPLVCTSPMFGMPAYVHPSIATTYAVVGSALADRASADVPWPAADLLHAPPGQAHLPQRSRGGGAVRRARLHGRAPRGPLACPTRPGWCGTPRWWPGSPAAGCSRSRSPAGRSTWC